MHLAYDTDEGAARRAALGLIILQVDETIEADFARLIPEDGIRLFNSRIPSAPEVTPETLPHMAANLPTAASLLPAHAGLDVIGYACTSGATALGERKVTDLVTETQPGAQVTNPLTALKAACRALGIRRLGLVSPYVAAVSQSLREALAADGIETTAFGTFDQKEERVVARITTDSILAALNEVAAGDCEAVFASCTNLRAVEVLAQAERETGKPMLASNQVLAWHMLRLAGIEGPVAALGALAETPLPAPAPAQPVPASSGS